MTIRRTQYSGPAPKKIRNRAACASVSTGRTRAGGASGEKRALALPVLRQGRRFHRPLADAGAGYGSSRGIGESRMRVRDFTDEAVTPRLPYALRAVAGGPR